MDSNNNNNLYDINSLVDELKSSKNFMHMAIPSPSSTEKENVSEENIEAFVCDKASTLIQQGLDVLESLKLTILSGGTSDEVESYSKLMASVTGSLEVLNKINIQKRKDDAKKELKMIDIDKKQLQPPGGENHSLSSPKNQINIIATREEIMEKIVSRAFQQETDIIDVE